MKEECKKIIFESITKMNPRNLMPSYLQEEPLDQAICVLSIGKASNEMAKAVYDFYKEQIKAGLIICPENTHDYHLPSFNRIVSSHPVPTEKSILAGKDMLDFLRNYQTFYLLVLISGGGSSLVEVIDDRLSLEALQRVNQQLIHCGASIDEINIVRKHLSLIKGGQILPLINVQQSKCYILSDVCSGDLSNVASGLTFRDESSRQDAIEVVERYIPEERSYLIEHLRETPKDVVSMRYECIGDNRRWLKEIKSSFEKYFYHAIINPYALDDYANMAGLNISCQIYRYLKSEQKPLAIIYGGETIVKLRGKGIGGRSCELALSASIEIQGMRNVLLASICSDGKDGNSPSCGAIVDVGTVRRIEKYGGKALRYLKNNDSYNALNLSDDIIYSYRSGTNVNDAVVVVVF